MKKSGQLKRPPMPRRGAPLRVRNARRAALRFRRNFHSEAFVCFTRGCACAFCGSVEYVVNGHAQHSRGAGGDWRVVLPVCMLCDCGWEALGRETFLKALGLTLDDVPTLLKAHHERAIAAGVITRDELAGGSLEAGTQESEK
jgi:hypothetical protein